MRAIRIERNLSQEGLAAALPSPHHNSWVSKVEKGTQDLLLSDLYAIAGVLQVDAGWLVSGDATDSEFLSRLRSMESQMDERGQREVLATAERQVEEAQKRVHDVESADAMAQRLIAAGFGRAEAIRAVTTMTGIAPSLEPGPADAAARQERQQASGA